MSSYTTAVSIYDGAQWIVAAGHAGSAGRNEYHHRMFVAPGDYRWKPVLIDPVECREPPPNELEPPGGQPLTVPACEP